MGMVCPTLILLCCLPFAHQAKQRPAVDCLTTRRAVVVSPHTGGPRDYRSDLRIICTPSPQHLLANPPAHPESAIALSCFLMQSEKCTKNIQPTEQKHEFGRSVPDFLAPKKGISAWENSRNSNWSFEFRISPSAHWMHDAHAHTCPLYRRFPFYCRDFSISFGFNFSPSSHWIPNPSYMHTYLPLVQKGGSFVCFFNYPFWARMIHRLCLLLVMSLLQKTLFQ